MTAIVFPLPDRATVTDRLLLAGARALSDLAMARIAHRRAHAAAVTAPQDAQAAGALRQLGILPR